MVQVPKKAFVLAAGLGQRMRPLTNDCPKPLLVVGGKTMLDRILDSLEEAGVEEVVVNAYYLGHMIEEHLQQRKKPKIRISKETELLDTGGGVKNALHYFGNEPFYVLNADVIWTDGPDKSTLQRLADQWDPSKMDLLLLLHKTTPGKGDYKLAEGSNQPVFGKHPGNDGMADYMFIGPRIVHPRLFQGAPEGAFSFLDLFHKAEKSGRLQALRHDGAWHHVGTPEEFERTNKLLSPGKQKNPHP